MTPDEREDFEAEVRRLRSLPWSTKSVPVDRAYVLARVKVDPTTGCWIWTRSLTRAGYGQVGIGADRGAHRVAFQLWKGAIPSGRELDHLCRVRACVNPEHLEAVTAKENTLRGVSPMARLAARTHCSRGHAYTPDNIWWKKDHTGTMYRSCRACGCARNNADRARRQAMSGKPPRKSGWPLGKRRKPVQEKP